MSPKVPFRPLRGIAYKEFIDDQASLRRLFAFVPDKGNLLARVTFDYDAEQNIDTIVRQTDSDVIKVEWKIEITSLNENFVEYNQADNWYDN